MGRRRWNKKHPDKARAQQQQRPEEAADPPVRLLALQPGSSVVAVGIGSRVTIANYETGEEVKLATSVNPAPAAAAAAGNATTAAAAPAAAGSGDANADNPPGAAAPTGGTHAGSLRVLQFSPDGRSLLTGGDDKAAKLWHVAPGAAWRCGAVWRTPKKTSAAGFTLDGAFALVADKFGDVLLGQVPAEPPAAVAEPVPQVPSTLLGHFCSIVTGVVPSPCGRFLATSDKDYKVRISVLPADLVRQISCDIQCYCLGHQDFVSCIAFASNPHKQEQQQEAAETSAAASGAPSTLLLSGGGDGTVRVWDHLTGRQRDSYVATAPVTAAEAAAAAGAAAEAGEAEGATASGAVAGGDGSGAEEGASGGGDDGDDEGEEEGAETEEAGGDRQTAADGGDGGGDGDGGAGEPQRRRKVAPCAPVLSLAVSEDGTTVAVVVEGDDEVQLLTVDWGRGGRLALKQRLRWPDVRYPCQAAFGPGGLLWVVGGVPLPTARSVHVGVAKLSAGGLFEPCTEQILPAATRALLEARVEEEEAKMAAGGELFVYSKHLRKPEYDQAEALSRKRQRNDHKETQRLAALRQRQDEKKAAAQGQQQPQGKQPQGQQKQEQVQGEKAEEGQA